MNVTFDGKKNLEENRDIIHGGCYRFYISRCIKIEVHLMSIKKTKEYANIASHSTKLFHAL
jgi:hypothetical protein